MSRRVSLVLVMGLLVCALSTLEIPELLKLTDNTSNDYSTAVFQKNKIASVTLRAQSPDVARFVVLTLPVVERARPTRAAESCESSQSLPDLLHLLCIRRT